ncbi:hypothetical protein [Saccharothrix lopnurensis]|uniref:Uncharacterized protein n=1 Tax=Saccharothrix lopnurensis TaxID=1670621 RepID=A0ABW1PFH8_9PSEU
MFQDLRRRPPFDDLTRREELRQRLNGIDLPAAKVDLRPGLGLGVLLDAPAREQLIEVLGRFHAVAVEGQPADSKVSWRARRDPPRQGEVRKVTGS